LPSGSPIIGTVAMDRPPWRYAPEDGQLHLIRREVGGVAEALCPFRVPVAELEEPGAEDRPRCPLCVRAYGTELSERVSGVA
jgi:hypothetical protein